VWLESSINFDDYSTIKSLQKKTDEVTQ